jgi:hypothetical protein
MPPAERFAQPDLANPVTETSMMFITPFRRPATR